MSDFELTTNNKRIHEADIGKPSTDERGERDAPKSTTGSLASKTSDLGTAKTSTDGTGTPTLIAGSLASKRSDLGTARPSVDGTDTLISTNNGSVSSRKPDLEAGKVSIEEIEVPLATTDSNSSKVFPDGGLPAWTCVLGSFFALFCTFGWLNALGLFQTYYEQTLLSTNTPSEISWIFTIQLFFMWAGGGIFGRVIDTYGTHYVAVPCSLGCTGFVFLISMCTRYYSLILVQGVGFGICAAGLFSCATTSVGQYFDKRKALALGIALSGSSTGGFLHPLYLKILIDDLGFKQALRWASLVIGVTSALSCLLMRARLPKKKWGKGRRFIDFSLFKQSTFSVYCLGTFFVTWGLFAPWTYLPGMSLRHGFSDNAAVYTIVVLNAASTIGRILPGHLADRLGRFNLITIITMLNVIFLLAVWFPLEVRNNTTHVQIFAFAAIYGFSSGAFIGVMMSVVADLGDVEDLGQRFGTYQVIVGFGSLTGLPIQGALIPAAHHGFTYLILFSGVCMVIGAGFICAARMLRGGASWRV